SASAGALAVTALALVAILWRTAVKTRSAA
ncbi:MAG: hypothetical protein JWQ88_3209, partial [Rhodoferax sp.]|nr:hypothetical protein [Rhodoferax sp.]